MTASSRLRRSLLAAVLCCAAAAPTAHANTDLRSPDARDAARPTASPAPTDLRSPDTRDRANAYTPAAQDLRSPDTRDLANSYTPPPVQDLRSPDTRDLANGYTPTSATRRHAGINTTTWALLAFALAACAAGLATVTRARHTRIPPETPTRTGTTACTRGAPSRRPRSRRVS